MFPVVEFWIDLIPRNIGYGSIGMFESSRLDLKPAVVKVDNSTNVENNEHNANEPEEVYNIHLLQCFYANHETVLVIVNHQHLMIAKTIFNGIRNNEKNDSKYILYIENTTTIKLILA
ncbi:hypothetical protein BpHYR1_028892 [Brachionus plicatilis]|uniref:Uncharacterized protein n=1 Tax=Brachionus plicatilis TaxID=10195 RepID=A0A3M7RZU8_BRAPC|nr:hypothetical protein BpHYR1_028892 [Brachionus plicatilis]